MSMTPEQVAGALQEIQKQGNPEGFSVIDFVIAQILLGNIQIAKNKIILDNDKLLRRKDVIEIVDNLFDASDTRRPYSL